MAEDKWKKRLEELVREKTGQKASDRTVEDTLLGSGGTAMMAKEHGRFWLGVATMMVTLILEQAADDESDSDELLQNATACIGALWCVAYQEAIKQHGVKKPHLQV